MSRTISLINQLPSNKEELKSFFEIMKSETLSGEYNIINISEQIDCIKRLCEMYTKDNEIQEELLTEVEKYHINERPKNLTIRETGVKYDYLSCNHLVYNNLVAKRDELNNRIKSIEKTLQQRDIIETDPETGETFEAHKASKSSTTKVIFNLK